MFKCPGQDLRFWKPEDIFTIPCPQCHSAVEFWKDDPQRKCPQCKTLVTNPKLDISCAQWCKHAQECLGISSVDKNNILCNRIIEELKKLFPHDLQRVDQALDVLGRTGPLQQQKGGDPLIVKAAAVLQAIASPATGAPPAHTPGPNGSQDPVQLARAILTTLSVAAEPLEQICGIISHLHDQTPMDSVEYQIVADARRQSDLS